MSVVASDRSSNHPRFVEPPLSPEQADALTEGVVGPDHKARVIRAALGSLDLSALCASYQGKGSAAFPPLLLLAVCLFQAHEGHFSPARWFKHARESIPVRWLLRGLVPSRSA